MKAEVLKNCTVNGVAKKTGDVVEVDENVFANMERKHLVRAVSDKAGQVLQKASDKAAKLEESQDAKAAKLVKDASDKSERKQSRKR